MRCASETTLEASRSTAQLALQIGAGMTGPADKHEIFVAFFAEALVCRVVQDKLVGGGTATLTPHAPLPQQPLLECAPLRAADVAPVPLAPMFVGHAALCCFMRLLLHRMHV